MDKIFPIEKNYCKIFIKKDSPEFAQTKLPRYLTKTLSEWSINFASENYFRVRLCLLHEKIDAIIFTNFPNIEVVDDLSILFLLKIYKLYELLKMKMVNYNSPKKNIIIFNKNINFDTIAKYTFIKSVQEGKIYSINFTNDDLLIMASIIGSGNIKFDTPTDNIFNRYLRETILTEDFYRKLAEKKTKDVEKLVGERFEQIKKQDPNFLSNTKKQFKLEYNSLMDKLNKFFKTDEYKEFQDSLVVKQFKFPMKEYFGESKPITYNCFKTLVDEFEAEVVEKLNL